MKVRIGNLEIIPESDEEIVKLAKLFSGQREPVVAIEEPKILLNKEEEIAPVEESEPKVKKFRRPHSSRKFKSITKQEIEYVKENLHRSISAVARELKRTPDCIGRIKRVYLGIYKHKKRRDKKAKVLEMFKPNKHNIVIYSKPVEQSVKQPKRAWSELERKTLLMNLDKSSQKIFDSGLLPGRTLDQIHNRQSKLRKEAFLSIYNIRFATVRNSGSLQKTKVLMDMVRNAIATSGELKFSEIQNQLLLDPKPIAKEIFMRQKEVLDLLKFPNKKIWLTQDGIFFQ